MAINDINSRFEAAAPLFDGLTTAALADGALAAASGRPACAGRVGRRLMSGRRAASLLPPASCRTASRGCRGGSPRPPGQPPHAGTVCRFGREGGGKSGHRRAG